MGEQKDDSFRNKGTNGYMQSWIKWGRRMAAEGQWDLQHSEYTTLQAYFKGIWEKRAAALNQNGDDGSRVESSWEEEYTSDEENSRGNEKEFSSSSIGSENSY